MPKLKVPEKLERFLTVPKRFKIAVGGRGGCKSRTFADLLLMLAQTQGHKVGCFREMQNSIEDSVHALLKSEIERMRLEGFIVQQASIVHKDGGEFKFKGLARNPDAVKSMEGFTRFWVEEAHSLSAESLKILTPTLREEDSEIWFSLNRKSSQDPMSKRFLVPYEDAIERDGYYEDDLHLIVEINYQDNPWFPKSLDQERQWDYIHKPRAEYDHIWGGKYNDSVEDSIIKAEWFDACVDAHIKKGFKPKGVRVVSHDPSESGDEKALCYRHGSVVLDVQEKATGDVNEGCDWATDFALQHPTDLFVWDADGLGISLKRQIGESLGETNIDYQMFKGSEGTDNPDAYYQDLKIPEDQKQKRKNKDTFKNKRAQYYWQLRDRVYKTYLAVEKKQYIDPDELISFSSEIKNLQKLRSEVCRIPLIPNGNGLIQIMSKPDMKSKLKISSPNMGDSVMMSLIGKTVKKDKFLEDIQVNTRYVI